MPECFGKPAVTNACAFYQCMRGCGCAKHPAFPAPSLFEGETNAKLGQILPREGGVVSLTPSLRGAKRRRVRRSPTGEGGRNPDCFRGRALDCFAPLAMTIWLLLFDT